MSSFEDDMRRVENLRKQMKPLEDIRKAMKPLEDIEKAMKPLVEAEKMAKLHDQLVNANPLAGLVRPREDYYDAFEAIERGRAEAAEAPTARRAVTRILEEIRDFEAQLDDASEVGIRLVSFTPSSVLYVEGIGFSQPNLIIFYGHREDQSAVRLIQHLSQLSFLLTRVPRLEPEKPRRPIGFHVDEEV